MTVRDVIQAVGRDHGWEEVKVEIMARRDLAITWERWGDEIIIGISDYAESFPDEVIRGMAEKIFTHLDGEEIDWSDAVYDYVQSDSFVLKHQGTYIGRVAPRVRAYIVDDKHVGWIREVQADLERDGISLPPFTKIFWGTFQDNSATFRVIVIPELREDIEPLFKKAVAESILSVDAGFGQRRIPKQQRFAAILSRYDLIGEVRL